MMMGKTGSSGNNHKPPLKMIISCYKSNDYDNWRHGIESANMKGETRDNGYGVYVPCDTDTCGNR